MSSNSILSRELKSKYGVEIKFIRDCAKMGKIKISDHCYEVIGRRKIKVSAVYDSIKNGVVMEIQNFERDTKILFQDSINTPPNFFVVVAVRSNMGLCVTTYLPDEGKWVLGLDNQWRRK